MKPLRNAATSSVRFMVHKLGYELIKKPQEIGQKHITDEGPGDKIPKRILVNTMPKAGTHLFSGIVETMGFHNTNIHIEEQRIQAYDQFALEDGLRKPRRFDVKIPVWESRKLIRFGELAFGHLEYSRENELYFRNYKIILVVRELRSAIISYARMMAHSGRGGYSGEIINDGVCAFLRVSGSNYLRKIEKINSWKNCEQTLLLKFEDLHKEPERVVSDISKHLDVDINQPKKIYEKALTKETLTKSSDYVKLDWTDQAEQLFTDLGGLDLNAKLGY